MYFRGDFYPSALLLPSLSLFCLSLSPEMEIHDFGKQQNGKKEEEEKRGKEKSLRGGFVRDRHTMGRKGKTEGKKRDSDY